MECLFNKVTEFEINNTSGYVLYMINTAKGPLIGDRTSNSMEKSMENSKFEIYSHI